MSAADEPRPERREGGEPEPDEQPIDAERSEASPRDEERDAEERDAEERFEEEEEEPVLDEVDLRELLRGALQTPEAPRRDLLRGVQSRLRTRSQGKFYADGWSTSRAPRSLYLTTSILMLALIAFVFLVLIPWGGGALP